MFKFKPKKAFTLIELLVVIAIIGILVTVAVVALNNARAKARDSKRLANIKQVQTALELFYNDMNRYPTQEEFNSGALFSTSTGATTTYMVRIPDGPNPPDGTCTPEQNTLTYIAPTDGTSYTLSYCLGGPAGSISSGPHCATPAGIADGSSCGSGGGATPECTADTDCNQANNEFCCADQANATCAYQTCANQITYEGGPTSGKYDVIRIGTQYWLRQNLNVGSYMFSSNDPASDPQCHNVVPSDYVYSCQGGAGVQKYCYDNNSGQDYCATDGGLYEWAEAMGLPYYCNNVDYNDLVSPKLSDPGYENCAITSNQGICPTGWHVPSDNDWHILDSGLADDPNTDCYNPDLFAGIPNCSPAGSIQQIISPLNFSAVLSGIRDLDGSFAYRNNYAEFWSSTPSNTLDYSYGDLGSLGYPHELRVGDPGIYHYYNSRASGYSVRCIKD